MGKMETLTPVKSKPVNRLTHNLSKLIMSMRGTLIPNLVKIRSRELLGKRVKYNFLCDFLYISSFFFLDHRREETPRRILTLNGSKDAESRKDVPFGVIK